ncbi:MAG: AhpC/TSA family protein [Chitinophagales bacterium]|nr:AhpC/TSA family protein [Chitinophagales bacterium]MDW8419233.1 TlpA disulfide reductase family protein [Chitinophagales bacterium]
MNKLLFSVLLLIASFACNSTSGSERYRISGTVKNHPAKSIRLEKMTLKEFIVVDSSSIQNDGSFNMEGVTEKGFYRLALDMQTFWIFYLEPVPYRVAIDLKAAEPFKISGSADNDELQAALRYINDKQRTIQSARSGMTMAQFGLISPDSASKLIAVLNNAGKELETYCLQNAKNAKNPLLAMFYITNLPVQNYAKENLEVIQRMEREIPNSHYTKELREFYNNYEAQAKAAAMVGSVNVGDLAPEIDLPDPEGKNIKLSSLKGKIVLVDFWASWCGPCRNEMPNVVAAYNKYKNKGFTVYSVSLDKSKEAWINSIKALNMQWPYHVSDLKFWQCEAALRYGVQGIPATFLLDREGKVIGTNLRGEELQKKLAQLLP